MVKRKAKAKRRGRPALPKGTQRQVYSVRLLSEQVDQAKALAVDGSLTTAVEHALGLWIDEYRRTTK